MKKVLLASAALALTAGAAAAEVSLAGNARMGLIYDGSDSLFTSRVRVIFNLSGETDGGLAFGASVRNDQIGGNGGTSTGETNGDSTVFISGSFGKLTMGDVGNASDAAIGHVSGVGLTGLGDTNELHYGQDKTAILYNYAAGDLGFYVSAGQIGSDDFGVAVKYGMGDYSVGLGYTDDGVAGSTITLGGSATFGDLTAKAVIQDYEFSDQEFALSVDYAMGATGLTAFYADHDTFETFGVGASYDLGGGAKIVGGVVDNSVDTVADFGLSFEF